MHCHAVIRELAVPTDDRDSTALAEHLATCAVCLGGHGVPFSSTESGTQLGRQSPLTPLGMQCGSGLLRRSINR